MPQPELIKADFKTRGRKLIQALVAQLASPKGRTAAAGLAALMAAAALHWGYSQRVREQAAQARAESAQTLQRAQAVQSRPSLPPQDPQVAFSSAFPDPQERESRLAALLELAQAMGLNARQIELRVQPEPALGLQRYQIRMPLESSYAAQRQFIDQALAADPALALMSLRMRRPNAQTDLVKTQLDFALLMRSEAQPATQPTAAAVPAPLRAGGPL